MRWITLAALAALLWAPGCSKREPAPADKPAGGPTAQKEAPKKEEPKKEEPKKEEPGKEEPGKEEPKQEEPGKEEPGKEEPGGATLGTMEAAEATIKAIEAGFAAFSEGKFDDALAISHDDIVWVNWGMPEVQGKDGVKQFWGMFKTAFPDMVSKPSLVWQAPGLTVAVAPSKGTHKGDFMGVPGTDKPVGATGLYFFEWKDGKLARVEVYSDAMGIMKQIGVVPTEGMPAPAPPAVPDAAEHFTGAENAEAVAMAKKAWEMPMGDMAAVDKMITDHYAADVKYHDMAMGMTVDGVDKMKEMMGMWAKGFPDATAKDIKAVGVGDYVIVRAVMSGTHKGDLPFAKATDKAVNMHLAEVMRLEDGKVKESWSFGNQVEMAMQLGLMPAPGAQGGGEEKKDEGGGEQPKDEEGGGEGEDQP